MSNAHIMRKLPLLLACCASLFSIGVGGVLAQAEPPGALGAGPGGALGAGPPDGPPGGPPRLSFPKQGFENTAQIPANYTSQEAAAVALVEKWIGTISDQDTSAQMALIDDDIVYRTDPLSPLGHGALGYCAIGPGLDVPDKGTRSTIQELYVVGGQSEALVLLRRQDHAPANPSNVGFLGGYTIPFVVLLRIRDGKIVEFYDAPTNKVSGGGMPVFEGFPPGGAPPAAATPERCMNLEAAAPAPSGGDETPDVRENYGTAKPEYLFNPYEVSAAQTVRSWFAAWQAGDPLLLAAFVNRNVVFRTNPNDELGQGRDNLLRAVCGRVGDKRKLVDLFVIGGDYDSSVLTRWDETNAAGEVTHMASYFRVQNGLISEWVYDTPLDRPPPAGGATSPGGNSPACEAVDAALGPPADR